MGGEFFNEITNPEFAQVNNLNDIELDVLSWATEVHIGRMRNEAIATIKSGTKEFDAIIPFAINQMYELMNRELKEYTTPINH